jgi:uncharacterized peroxidase-related enzyme
MRTNVAIARSLSMRGYYCAFCSNDVQRWRFIPTTRWPTMAPMPRAAAIRTQVSERNKTMSRITAIDPKTAVGETKALLDAVQAQLGVVPNFLRVLAHSPRALAGFLGLYGALGAASLDKPTQERIALAVAEGNACEYCLSAHTAIGRRAGLSNEEMLLNRRGSSADAKAAAAVALAAALNERTGGIAASDLDAARRAGLTDGEIVEVIAVVALNLFTNILGKSVRVDIDFPKVAPFAVAEAA